MWPRALSGPKALLNLVIVAPLAWGAVGSRRFPVSYAASVQEDGPLEWMTFWAFLLAAGLFVAGTVGRTRVEGSLDWFGAGLTLFCLFVALEEISWGQRLLGYRPPAYFLENNFQQELNLHNLVGKGLRKLALAGVLWGYGVALPLLGTARPAAAWLRRLKVWPPPLTLAPAFALSAAAYQIYPWSLTGEVVELALGAAMLLVALQAYEDSRGTADGRGRERGAALRLSGCVAAVLGLGAASSTLVAEPAVSETAKVAATRLEVEALMADILEPVTPQATRPATRCGLHRRLYTWVERSGVDPLRDGRFASRVGLGLPEERAAFFLDPWESPYWIRHVCAGERQLLIVYSFGPNRRRDSSRWTLSGDDVGATRDPTIGFAD